MMIDDEPFMISLYFGFWFFFLVISWMCWHYYSNQSLILFFLLPLFSLVVLCFFVYICAMLFTFDLISINPKWQWPLIIGKKLINLSRQHTNIVVVVTDDPSSLPQKYRSSIFNWCDDNNDDENFFYFYYFYIFKLFCLSTCVWWIFDN